MATGELRHAMTGAELCGLTGKVVHRSKEAARGTMLGRHPDSRIYRCGHCGWWHHGLARRPVPVTPARRRRPGR